MCLWFDGTSVDNKVRNWIEGLYSLSNDICGFALRYETPALFCWAINTRQVSRLSWWDTQSTYKAQWCYFLWSPVTKQWGNTFSSLNLECFAAINQMASLLTLTWSTLHWTVLCTFKELDNIQQPIRSPTRQWHSPLLRFLTLTVLYYGEMAGPTTFFFPAKNIWNSKNLFPSLRLFLLHFNLFFNLMQELDVHDPTIVLLHMLEVVGSSQSVVDSMIFMVTFGRHVLVFFLNETLSWCCHSRWQTFNKFGMMDALLICCFYVFTLLWFFFFI